MVFQKCRQHGRSLCKDESQLGRLMGADINYYPLQMHQVVCKILTWIYLSRSRRVSKVCTCSSGRRH